MLKIIFKLTLSTLVVIFLGYYVSFQVNNPGLVSQLAQAEDEGSEKSGGGSEKSGGGSEEDYEIVREEKVIVIEPEKIVYETRLQNVNLPDSDRDGIADEYDEYPEIAAIYIVKDENLNGIVDVFESIFE